ncbi:hypothetical protein ACFYTF_15955 [Nocardia thailandica]|uniref:DUF8176 domain-containing protein n=1 Tax=Nocardia thailandica TaxID=257275 RepID=A0ABW6PPJ2_9NOCA
MLKSYNELSRWYTPLEPNSGASPAHPDAAEPPEEPSASVADPAASEPFGDPVPVDIAWPSPHPPADERPPLDPPATARGESPGAAPAPARPASPIGPDPSAAEPPPGRSRPAPLVGPADPSAAKPRLGPPWPATPGPADPSAAKPLLGQAHPGRLPSLPPLESAAPADAGPAAGPPVSADDDGMRAAERSGGARHPSREPALPGFVGSAASAGPDRRATEAPPDAATRPSGAAPQHCTEAEIARGAGARSGDAVRRAADAAAPEFGGVDELPGDTVRPPAAVAAPRCADPDGIRGAAEASGHAAFPLDEASLPDFADPGEIRAAGGRPPTNESASPDIPAHGDADAGSAEVLRPPAELAARRAEFRGGWADWMERQEDAEPAPVAEVVPFPWPADDRYDEPRHLTPSPSLRASSAAGRGRARIVLAAAVLVLVLAATGVCFLLFGRGERAAKPADNTTPMQIAAGNVAAVTVDPCPPERTPTLVRSAEPGGTASGPDAVLAFQHGYYVARSGEAARAVVAPDAVVSPASVIQRGIDSIPLGTTHCVRIATLGQGRFAVEVTEFRPGGAPATYTKQLVSTADFGGRVLITGIAAG